MRQGETRDQIIANRPDGQSIRMVDNATYEDPDLVKLANWTIDIGITTFDQSTLKQRITATQNQLNLPLRQSEYGSAWVRSGANITKDDIKIVSSLKQRGEDSVLLKLLREIDDRVSGIELLAPGGDVAELFVRLDDGSLMLPVALMGEGFQRCLEIGAVVAGHEWPTLFIDEIENGMHHLALEPLWRWIATISQHRSLQVFATTHSEECIHAASRAFQALGDDGLRVIRLDRTESETRAALYDRALIEAAERTDTEIRG
jgi:predicted ATPase